MNSNCEDHKHKKKLVDSCTITEILWSLNPIPSPFSQPLPKIKVEGDNIIVAKNELCIFVIFQYNNVDFLTITPEKASTELNKPCAFVRMQAQYNPASK